MPSGHNDIRRLVHRAMEEVRASASIGRVCGLSDGINAFRAKVDLQVMNRNGYSEPSEVRSRLVRKHEAVMHYLDDLMGDYALSYGYCQKLDPIPEGMGGKIWMCWWQGVEHSPEIVKACIDSVKKNSAGREVIVITDANINEYVAFPEWVLELRRKGILSRTHLSDLLRLELLARYGGLWLDSTFFCCRPLSSEVYYAPLFSIKRPDYLHGSIASGYFANYALGCNEENRYIFAAIRDLFLEYWHRSHFLVDYLLTDYLIVMSQRNSVAVAESFSEIRPNNPMCDELFKVLEKPYDAGKWSRLCGNTDLFKLTWKRQFPIDCAGGDTFYGKLLKGGLEAKNGVSWPERADTRATVSAIQTPNERESNQTMESLLQ